MNLSTRLQLQSQQRVHQPQQLQRRGEVRAAGQGADCRLRQHPAQSSTLPLAPSCCLLAPPAKVERREAKLNRTPCGLLERGASRWPCRNRLSRPFDRPPSLPPTAPCIHQCGTPVYMKRVTTTQACAAAASAWGASACARRTLAVTHARASCTLCACSLCTAVHNPSAS